MDYRDHWNANSFPQVKFNGLKNQGSTCYLNSVLQVLFMTEDFREAVERFAHDNPGTKFIDHQLNHLFDELKTDTAQTNKITDKLKISRVYEQRDAAEYLEKILKQTSSEASQIFHGTLTHRTVCSNCEKPSDSDGNFWHLPLTLNSDGEYSVEDGISEYFRDTHFSGDDQIYCDICDDKYDATLKCVLKHPPEVLMLLLKRFELNIYTLTYFKNKRTVHVPSRLQISENPSYDLYAFVEHSGELGSGHYSATIKFKEDNNWYNFNDTMVTSLDFQPFQSDNFERSDGAYLLFYRKKGDRAADVCTLQDTDVMSAPEECPLSCVDSHNQPHNSEILRKEGDMAGGNRADGDISTDQDDDRGLKDDEDSVIVTPRAERRSPEPRGGQENHVNHANVERNHWYLQVQDKQTYQGELVPNDEEVERGSERKKKDSSFEASIDKDRTCEVRRAEPITTSQYGQNPPHEVRKMHEYPQNEGKTRENEKMDAEEDLKVDLKEQTESKKEGQHHDEERLNFVRQDMTGDMESGQQAGPDYYIKSCRKDKKDVEKRTPGKSEVYSESHIGADVTKPNRGNLFDLVDDRMQDNEKTGKKKQGRDRRYDRDVRLKEEMNVDRSKEENRWGECDHDTHMSVRDHRQDVVVVPERHRRMQVDEYCQNKDDSFLSGVKRRGTTDARGEVRAESNVDNVSERQPSTSKKEVKIKIYEETEVTPGSIERRLIREKSLQRTSDSRGNSLADDDKSRKEGFPGHFNITSRLKKDNNQSLSKCMRNLDLNESEQKQRAKREIGDVQEEDETKQVEKRVRAESESQEQDAAVKHETKSKKLHMKLRWPSSAKKTRKGRKKSCVLLCVPNKNQILDSD